MHSTSTDIPFLPQSEADITNHIGTQEVTFLLSMPWDVVGQPKPSILRPGSDDTTLEIIALCVGSILLTESIFLLIVIQGRYDHQGQV